MFNYIAEPSWHPVHAVSNDNNKNTGLLSSLAKQWLQLLRTSSNRVVHATPHFFSSSQPGFRFTHVPWVTVQMPVHTSKTFRTTQLLHGQALLDMIGNDTTELAQVCV